MSDWNLNWKPIVYENINAWDVIVKTYSMIIGSLDYQKWIQKKRSEFNREYNHLVKYVQKAIRRGDRSKREKLWRKKYDAMRIKKPYKTCRCVSMGDHFLNCRSAFLPFDSKRTPMTEVR